VRAWFVSQACPYFARQSIGGAVDRRHLPTHHWKGWGEEGAARPSTNAARAAASLHRPALLHPSPDQTIYTHQQRNHAPGQRTSGRRVRPAKRLSGACDKRCVWCGWQKDKRSGELRQAALSFLFFIPAWDTSTGKQLRDRPTSAPAQFPKESPYNFTQTHSISETLSPQYSPKIKKKKDLSLSLNMGARPFTRSLSFSLSLSLSHFFVPPVPPTSARTLRLLNPCTARAWLVESL